ncbi:MAG: OmpA family protein [Bacteroidota bacterium]
MKSIKFLFAGIVLAFGSLTLFAQTQGSQQTTASSSQSFDLMPKRSDFNTWSVGLNVGPSVFYGTITSSAYYLQRPTLNPGIFYGLTLKKSLTHLLGLEADLSMGDLKGKNDVHHATMDTKVNYDFSINGVFTIGNFTWLSRNHKINFMGSVGFGQISFLPKLTDDMKADKADIYQRTFKQYPDSLFQHTGLGNTSEFTFPVSLGVLYDLTHHINLMLRYRYTVSMGSKMDYTWSPLVYSQSYGWASLGVIYIFGKKDRNIDWVNPIGDIYNQIADVKKQIAGLADTVKKQLADEDQKMKDLQGKVDKQLGDVNTRIDSMKLNINDMRTTINNYNTTMSGDSYLPSLYFPIDGSTIQYTDYERLAHLAKLLVNHPDMKLMITGNCDESASNDYNKKLGQMRADEAKKHLVKVYGIDANRLMTESKGKTEPFAKNILAINRRVDFTIIKNTK